MPEYFVIYDWSGATWCKCTAAELEGELEQMLFVRESKTRQDAAALAAVLYRDMIKAPIH